MLRHSVLPVVRENKLFPFYLLKRTLKQSNSGIQSYFENGKFHALVYVGSCLLNMLMSFEQCTQFSRQPIISTEQLE